MLGVRVLDFLPPVNREGFRPAPRVWWRCPPRGGSRFLLHRHGYPEVSRPYCAGSAIFAQRGPGWHGSPLRASPSAWPLVIGPAHTVPELSRSQDGCLRPQGRSLRRQQARSHPVTGSRRAGSCARTLSAGTPTTRTPTPRTTLITPPGWRCRCVETSLVGGLRSANQPRGRHRRRKGFSRLQAGEEVKTPRTSSGRGTCTPPHPTRSPWSLRLSTTAPTAPTPG